MNRSEVANLLAVIQTYDQRTVGETDVIAWHGAVGDLAFNEGRDAVLEHYKTTTDRIMPAHLRQLVQAARVKAAGEERAQELTARQGRSSQELVPMPDWFRTTVEEHRKRARAARQQAEEAGEPVTFGNAILHAVDAMPKGSKW